MSTRRQITARIGIFLDVVGSAVAVASAAEGGRQPKPRDLRMLGIDPQQFGRIGR